MKSDVAENMNEQRIGGGESFLDSVARAYVENFEDLSEFCFVFSK